MMNFVVSKRGVEGTSFGEIGVFVTGCRDAGVNGEERREGEPPRGKRAEEREERWEMGGEEVESIGMGESGGEFKQRGGEGGKHKEEVHGKQKVKGGEARRERVMKYTCTCI